MGRFEHFTLREFLHSDTAVRKGIDNTPDFEEVEHLGELVGTILEPLRVSYGEPITVRSGYRCPELNKAVGGVATSAHLRGYAADLQAADMEGFKAFVREYLRRTRVRFDQCIIERSGAVEWVHIGLYSSTGAQRGQLFSLTV